MTKLEKLLKQLESVSPEDRKKLSEDIETEIKKLSEDAKKEKEKLDNDLKKSGEDLKLSEEKVKGFEEKTDDSTEVEKRLKLAESETKTLKEQVVSLTETMAKDAKTAEFDVKLTEGKVCEAQRESFMDGDFLKFADLAQEVKLSESGANSKGDESENDATEKIIKLTEKKIKDTPEMGYGEAMKEVLSENPKLQTESGQ